MNRPVYNFALNKSIISCNVVLPCFVFSFVKKEKNLVFKLKS